MKHLKLLVAKRHEFGRGSMKRLRASGKVPAVVYGHSGTTALTVDEKELKALLKEKGHSASLIDIEVEGDAIHLSDIADIQRDPVTDKFLHIDFHEVSQSEKMTTVVPLEFSGEAVGVKQSGGILDIVRHEVTVRCLPADLPSSIRVDISTLDIGTIVHLSDLVAPGGVELLGDQASPIISCNAVVAEEETKEAVAKEAATAEIPATEEVAQKTE
ncbi:MAG: 50S ribosomal protein L25 [Puniceicoccales bacterium]|jgi:large subunit ribosomal protein L25|nr:50S ribosomal protein L25 [Puniceicoccales bacterium]